MRFLPTRFLFWTWRGCQRDFFFFISIIFSFFQKGVPDSFHSFVYFFWCCQDAFYAHLDQTHVNRNKISIIIGFFLKKKRK
jgi:hypothetical protein